MLLVAGAVLALGQAAPSGAGSMAGSAIKIGLVLGAFWLALPQIDRFFARVPLWLLATSFGGLLLVVIRPWAALAVIPSLVAIWALSVKWLGVLNKIEKITRITKPPKKEKE